MGVTEILSPTAGMVGNTIARYAWVIFVIIGLIFIIGGVFVWKLVRKKKLQWTHKLKIRRVLFGNRLSDPFYINCRRFPLIKKAEVFELETPLLGGYLLPELDEYSGQNEFSIILDKNNRIYTNTGEFFCPDKSSVNVSAKHSEIDIQRSNLKADFQEVNAVTKRVEWATIAKWAFMFVAIICITIVTISAIGKWAETQTARAESEKAQAVAMENLAQAMITVESTVNTQKLEILPMMKEIYKTKNIQGIIKEPVVLENEEEED